MKPWPHQTDAINQIEAAWSQGVRSVCYQLPTGGGKSMVIRMITDRHHEQKKKIYIVAHRKNLVKQLSNEVLEAGIKHGIIMSNSPYIRYRVQVASLQTIVNRLDKIDEPEIIIIDELHHAKSNSYMRLINKYKSAKILGVTATPQRLDGKSLSDVCQKLITGPSMKWLIENNRLSDYEYLAPDTVSMVGVHRRMGDYVSSEASERVDKHTITGCAIEHYRKYADKKPAIACCISIEHAEHVANDFRQAGYRAVAVHSKMKQYDIDRAIAGLGDGSVDVLSQCDLLGEGIDIPGATCLIGLRPTQSIVVFLQHVGRVLRYREGKQAIILDHVGNWERHGLPDDDREWSLDAIERKKSEQSKYKRCPKCIRPVPVSTRNCPFCKYQWYETKEKSTRLLPIQVDGELVNVKNRKPWNDVVLEIARNANSLKDAIFIAKSCGYKHTAGFSIWKNILKNS